MVLRTNIEVLAAAIPDRDLSVGFLRGAHAMLPRPPAPMPHRAVRDAYDGLTAREREIADTLVVGERTVDTHISNIVSKLGFTSRRQIATWAVDKGLAKRAKLVQQSALTRWQPGWSS